MLNRKFFLYNVRIIRGTAWLMGLLLLLTTALSSYAARPAASTTNIVVNSTADTQTDDDQCTLREAMLNAINDDQSGSADCGAGSGADTITFSVTTPATILLSSQLPQVSGGGLLTITGPGPDAAALTLDGGGSVGVFYVPGSGSLALETLTVANGFADYGGGLRNKSGTVEITGSIFSGNRANPSYGGLGGGLHNENGMVDITNSHFTGNSGLEGGGIYNNTGVLDITNSTISDNTAVTGFGGGLASNAGTISITGSTISSNMATLNTGGGIYTGGSAVQITNSTFSDNSAGLGGGLFYGNGVLDITGSTFTNNSADFGGGLYTYHPHGTVNITNTTFSGNSATIQGGALYNRSAIVNILNSTINNNTAVTDGGGILNAGTLTIIDTTMAGNSADNAGGGIANTHSLTITGSTISDNSAGFAGGGIFNNGSIATTELTNTTLISNEGDERGGGIYNVEGNTELINSLISHNSAPALSGIGGHGGGIYNAVEGTVIVTESTISNNNAYRGGGGIISDGGLVELTSSTVSENSAQGDGGGVHSSGGVLKLSNSTVSGNNALQNGGGIYSSFETTTELIHVTISHNSATLSGGGIVNDGSIVNLTNTLVGDNLTGSDCRGTIVSNGHNLDSDGSCSLVPALGDLPGTPTGLDPLRQLNLPGKTETHALLPGSAAIDAADPATCAAAPVNGVDQRGTLRPGVGTADCDIGAYELQASSSCVSFADPPLGTTYHVGDTFVDSGVTISATTFVLSNGMPVSGGLATIENGGQAGGAGQEIRVNNISLAFNFSTPLSGLSLRFGEYGGNLNVNVNGDFRNFENFTDINSQTIGGARVAVVNGLGNDMGTVTLTGLIHAFAIGGQEFYVDDVCSAQAEQIFFPIVYYSTNAPGH